MVNHHIELSMVIPVYNEGAYLLETLEEIEKEVRKAVRNYEIIVVDDGSDDDTWSYLEQCRLKIDNLEGIQLSRHFGKEFAICAGLEHAQGEAVIVMDAHLHPSSAIPHMVDLWKSKKGEIIEGVRRTNGEETLTKTIGSRLFHSILNKGTGYNFKGASEFQLLDRKVVQAWSQMSERNTFFGGMSNWLGFKRVQFTFDALERYDEQSLFHQFLLVKLAVKSVFAFSALPLRFVSFAGLLFLIGACLLGGQALYQKIVGNPVTGLTTIIILQLVMGSMIMISLGIIGEYVASIYNETKGRPRYVINGRISAQKNDPMVSRKRERILEAIEKNEWVWGKK